MHYMSQILKPSGICLFLFLQRYSLFHIKGIFGVTIVFYFQCTLSIYHLSINLGKKREEGGGEGGQHIMIFRITSELKWFLVLGDVSQRRREITRKYNLNGFKP